MIQSYKTRYGLKQKLFTTYNVTAVSSVNEAYFSLYYLSFKVQTPDDDQYNIGLLTPYVQPLNITHTVYKILGLYHILRLLD